MSYGPCLSFIPRLERPDHLGSSHFAGPNNAILSILNLGDVGNDLDVLPVLVELYSIARQGGGFEIRGPQSLDDFFGIRGLGPVEGIGNDQYRRESFNGNPIKIHTGTLLVHFVDLSQNGLPGNEVHAEGALPHE